MKPYQKEKRLFLYFLAAAGLCFAIGVSIGVLRQGTPQAVPETLSDCFFERGKWVISAFLLGFFPFGLFFVLPLLVCCGFLFGVVAANCFENPTAYLLLFFYYLPFLAALLVMGSAAALLSFSRYLYPENKKASLPREKQRKYVEYTIFFLFSLCLTFLSTCFWYWLSS